MVDIREKKKKKRQGSGKNLFSRIRDEMHAYAIIFSVFFIHCVLLLFRQLLSVFHGATHSQLSELGKEGRRWHLVTAAREGTHSQRPERVFIHSGQRGYSFTAATEGIH